MTTVTPVEFRTLLRATSRCSMLSTFYLYLLWFIFNHPPVCYGTERINHAHYIA